MTEAIGRRQEAWHGFSAGFSGSDDSVSRWEPLDVDVFFDGFGLGLRAASCD